jgi:chaperone required for assembly of F1-ATPase
MSGWTAKRFYKTASVVVEDGGFAVRLDGRPVRTPGKRALLMPTEIMAERVAEEWLAQETKIDPRTMPWTRSANSALDKVATQRAEVAAHLIDYAGTDLLCYRAVGPEGLVERQRTFWDPILDWVTQRYDVRFRVTSGVMPVEQDAESLPRLARSMDPMSDFQLTGFYELVTLSGSFTLALAAVESVQAAEDLWKISRIDEDWQAEQWGVDEDAAEMSALKRAAFLHARDFYRAA